MIHEGVRPIIGASKHEIKLSVVLSSVPDWRDLTIVLCLALILLGISSLMISAQTSVLISGKILEVGIATINQKGGGSEQTRTITVLIENNDRVFMIDRGTAVKYAISDADAALVDVGAHARLLVSSYSSKAKVISVSGGPDL